METTWIVGTIIIPPCGPMNDDAFWDNIEENIEAVGVHLSYQFGGWYASCEAGSFGPYASREDALAGLIGGVLEQLHQIHTTIKEHPLLLQKHRPTSEPERN